MNDDPLHRRPPGLITRSLRIGDVELVVDELGSGDRLLLLLHGFTGSRLDWSPVIAELAAAGWRVVAPDHRGHGDSGRPEDESSYSIGQLATDALAIVDALGHDRFVVVGHSLGGAVAQEMVLREPERIEALVLMDTTAGAVAIDRELVGAANHIVRTRGMTALAEAMAEGPDVLGTPAHEVACERIPGYREKGDRDLVRTSPFAYAPLADEITSRADLLERLAAISCPTLVVVGEQDETFIDASRSIAATIPDAHLAVIGDAGHSAQFEHTQGWLDAVLPFLAGI